MGLRVACRYAWRKNARDLTFYKGQIVAISSDFAGSVRVDIRYDDGDSDKHVPLRHLRLLKVQSALRPLPSALCPLPSALCPLPSTLVPLPSRHTPLIFLYEKRARSLLVISKGRYGVRKG